MDNRKRYFVSLVTIGILFFIFGFVTWLNGTLIPFLKIACELTTFQALLVTFAFYISYFVMALPSSVVLKKIGFQNGMALGLLIMAIGSIIFIPAAYSRQYWIFLTGLFIQGTGLALLQTAVNPYVTVIGPEESAAKRISIMGICNKVAGVASPLILGTIILKGANSIIETLKNVDENNKQLILNELSQRVVIPYIIIAVTLLALSFMIKLVKLPVINTTQTELPLLNNKNNVFQFPYLVLGTIAIFLYVGAEVIAGDTIILYGQSQGISIASAKYYTSLTLLGMVIGYIIGIILIPKYLSQSKSLAISAILGVILSSVAILIPAYLSFQMNFYDLTELKPIMLEIPYTVFFIALLGFANAIMWPAIWPLSISGLGKFTEKGSALLIMGILGGAILPPLYGLLSQAKGWTNQSAYLILIPMYLYIIFFATKGHKLRNWDRYA